MFEVGNTVMHPSAGVCSIEDIREEKFTDKKRTYYIMHPVSDTHKSTIYVPVDTDKVHLRKLMSKEEIICVIRHSATEEIEWIDNSNLRKAAYLDIVHSDDLSRIIALLTKLHRRKIKLLENGKKFPAADEKIMHDAEKKVFQEFSHSLSIQEECVPEFIMSQLSEVQ